MAGESVGNAYLNVVPKVDGDAKSLGSKFGNELSGGATAALTTGAVAMGNILANVITSVASTAGEQLSKAFWNYADYEQLVGGVETLFKDASQTVQDNAKQAFRTAGMSANEYMENVTSFSASLISSLDGDTARAAQVADRAIIDMSDNANKMGTDMERITDAYQGFAKQNYTMLDNLKLGYGGTKQEMQRLLDDASKIAGVEFNIDSYADVIEAIHVIQESMDITGTTMEEGSKTISGSLNQLNGAWDNFLTAVGDGGRTMDLSQVTNDLITSIGDVASNVLPALARIGTAVAVQLPQIIADALSGLPPVVRQGLVDAFGENAGTAFDSFMETLGQVQEIVMQAFEVVQNIITAAMPVIQQAIVPVVELIGNAISTAVSIALPIIQSVVDFIQSNIVPVIQQVFDFISSTVVPIISDIAAAVQANLPVVQGVFEQVMSVIWSVVETVWPAMQGLITAVLDGIQSVVSTVWPVIQNIMTTVWNTIHGIAQAVWPAISGIVQTAANVISGIINGLSSIVGVVSGIFNAVKSAIENPIETAKNIVRSAIDAISNIISGAHLQLPDIKLPHFNIDGGQVPWGIGGEGYPPSISIDWYAHGGIVDGAQLIGAGEAGPEMILPQHGGLMAEFAREVSSQVNRGGGANQTYNIYANDPLLVAEVVASKQRRALA